MTDKQWSAKLNKYIIENRFADAHKMISDLVVERAKEIEKAYGGCRKCYGKGYSTEKTSTTAFADFAGKDKKTEIMRYNPCDCDRGKEISKNFLKEYK